jgi:hypothetical protein
MKGICSGAAHLIRAAIDVEGLISLQGIRNSAWVIAIHSVLRRWFWRIVDVVQQNCFLLCS